jgi:phage protein D
MRTPFVTMSKQGSDIDLVGGWGERFVGLTITDESGTESDKMTLEIDDLDGDVQYPETGTVLHVSGGYREDGAVVQGDYEVNSVDLEGWPQKITVNGTSASTKKKNKERKTEKHDPETGVKTLGDLFEKIAGRNGWSAKVSDKLKQIPVEYEGQAAESDPAFATRLAARYGGLVAIKQGNMVVTQRGEGKSSSGQGLPSLIIERGVNILSYKVSWKDKPQHGKVKASYFDRKKVKKVDVEEDSDSEGGDVAFIIRKPFKNEKEAKEAAGAKSRELQRGEGSATFEIEGDPQAAAEHPIQVVGIRDRVDGTWNPTRVEHRWTTNSYTTTLECETPGKKSEGGGGE